MHNQVIVKPAGHTSGMPGDRCQLKDISRGRRIDLGRGIGLLWRLLPRVRLFVVGFGPAELNDGYAQKS